MHVTALAFLLGFFAQVFGIDRDEGNGKGTFPYQPTEEVGDSKGDEEGIGSGPGPEKLGHDHIAHKPEDPRDEGGTPDDTGGFGDGVVDIHAR